MKHKYIINIVFQQPVYNEAGQLSIATKTTSFGYEKYKEAKASYDKLNRRKYLEFDTEVGQITFDIVSVEIVDIKRYDENRANEVEDNGRTNDEEEEQSGKIEDATDEKLDSDNELETE